MKGPPVCLLWRERKVGFFHFLSFFKKRGGWGKRGGVEGGSGCGGVVWAQMLPPQRKL